MTIPEPYERIAITERSGAEESIHFGAVVALDPDGELAFSRGDPSHPIYPRSANKPMQAVAMVRAGLTLPPELLALVCACGAASTYAAVKRSVITIGRVM